jgi:transcriptional regulator with XRE-family HTH domain
MIIELIKQERLRRGYTISEFAEMIGIDAPHYSRIESGKIMPRLGLVERMLIELEIKVSNHKNRNHE